MTVVCFWPLVGYFLAQDDFVFLDRATRGLHELVAHFFDMEPGQFRPLTKGLYFMVTWPVFGLHATPYHVISILLHVLNAVLIGVLLRRMGFSAVASRVTAALFAFNVGFMEAVAWVSCVQQLIGNAFFLLTLTCGVDALSGRGGRARALTTVFYILALLSYEQTLAAPLVLLLWQCTRTGLRSALRAARGQLRYPLLALAVYLIFMFGAKGMPESGPYVMAIGRNVLVNLRTYSGLAFSIWLIYPAYGLPSGFTASHAVWIALGVFLLATRRVRELAFGVTTFLLLIAPVLFVSDHTHSFHLYVASIGAWFLVATTVDQIRSYGGAVVVRRLDLGLVLAVLVAYAGSLAAVRKNVSAHVSDTIPLGKSFVLRRATLAESMCRDIESRVPRSQVDRRLVFVYPAPEYAANWRNVYSAMGQGNAVRLLFGRPDLDVIFVPPLDMPGRVDPKEVLYYTELGRCYTAAEWRRSRSRMVRPGPAAMPDSSAAVTPAD